MPDGTNLFVVRGKLAGPPQIETITSKNGKSFNKSTFILEVSEERKNQSGNFTVTQVLKCQATSFAVDPQVIANIPVGSTVIASGKLSGRKNENNGRVSYFTDLEVSNLGYGTDDQIPF